MLRLFNTLTRKNEPFKHLETERIKMYSCGPSTYMRPHIGNYRTFLFEDVLQRYLEYLGYPVQRLMTLTDVEDKAIAEAKKENISLEQLTSRNEAQLFKDFEHLRIKVPDYMVRASTVVNQSARLAKMLLEKGYASWHMHEGRRNAYFEPSKFQGFGKLAHLDMSKWPKRKRRFHKDTYPGTPWNRGNFILWHGCKEGDVCWETEIGEGRPAWNIQDAAIVTEHLGFKVDIAAGGMDNLVRHHDYTLAVTEAVSSEKFANFWLHGAHLFVNGSKMSKSKGNVIYPDDLAAKAYTGDQIRFFLICRHYRRKLNFTYEKLDAAVRRLDGFKSMVQDLGKAESSKPSEEAKRLVCSIVPCFVEAMNDDLNVKGAFDCLFDIISKLDRLNKKGRLSAQDARSALEELSRVDRVLRVFF
ncbi:MAG TPA: class I tRNA ligase family protein [Candidatus Bathyarchaeia archaeon]|nr:class I tRNA ligase family protein [Candidatus Bathyarchaeia archaeon]